MSLASSTESASEATMSRAWPVACSRTGSCLPPDWTFESTDPMLVQPSTSATRNKSETAANAPSSWRRTDDIRNDTGEVLSGVERSG